MDSSSKPTLGERFQSFLKWLGIHWKSTDEYYEFGFSFRNRKFERYLSGELEAGRIPEINGNKDFDLELDKPADIKINGGIYRGQVFEYTNGELWVDGRRWK